MTLAGLRASVAKTLRVLEDTDRDTRAASPPPGEEGMTLRWVAVHLLGEWARHVGHADQLREAFDGQVGA